MRTDKQLPDETRADEDALSTEDIANANPRMERRSDDTDMPAEDMDAHTHDMDTHTEDMDMRTEDMNGRAEDGDARPDTTVTGTPVNGAEARDDDVETDSERAAQAQHARPQEDDTPPTVELLAAAEAERFRVQWKEIQTRFVDDPRDAVRDADQLVAEVMRSLATTFTDHKHDLEGRWQEGGDGVDTEKLRQALRHYRSFFDHLLDV